MKKIRVEQIREFLEGMGPGTKAYIGCDSRTYRKRGEWWAEYFLVCVIHKNGCNGCKIFGEIECERDFNKDKTKPRHRLITEAYKAAELYLRLAPVIDEFGFEIEVHLDLNPNIEHVSNMVLSEAVGYVKAMCNVVPMIKPDAFAASYAADRIGRVDNYDKVATINRK